MVKKGYGALIIGANSSCSNLNFALKTGDYPYKLCTFAPSKRKLLVNDAIESKYIHIIHTTIRLASSLRWGCFSAP